MNVLIVPDKFKGTLNAQAAAKAIARGWRASRPADRLTLLPLSDGGDGFGEILSTLLGAKRLTLRTVNAAHRACSSSWWWEADSQTAVIESANVVGLAMLPPCKFHPFQLDTFGLGKLIQAALRKGARRIIIGIGGSATNDGGFGLARALGWEFLDAQCTAIRDWTELHRLAHIQPPAVPLRHRTVEIIVASDVQNPLLGPRGATRVYGPQKGLRPCDFAGAERCLRQLARVVRRHFKRDLASLPGAGAAGGLGFGLAAFLGAKFRPGFDLFAEAANLHSHLRAADLVITGEGAIDESTLMGKGAGQVARLCRQLRIPCIGLAGTIVKHHHASRLFSGLPALTDLTTERNAKSHPALWLARLARRATVLVAAHRT